MVRKIRRQECRINTKIYGCVTDGQEFTFLYIDENDKVTYTRFILYDSADACIHSTLSGEANAGICI